MTVSILQLNPKEAYQFIESCIKEHKVAYLAGQPGIGKSQVVYSVAEAYNLELIDLRLSQLLSEDMSGLPERNADTGKAHYLPFNLFPLVGDKIPKGKSGWMIFLDELSSAAEEVLAAAYSLILDRKVGGRLLHKNCVIVAAGNRASDSAIARELPDTILTRVLPFEFVTDVESWVEWANSKTDKTNARVIDFIKKEPDLLHSFTHKKERDELEVYPTPRGWENVCAFVNAFEGKALAEAKGTDEVVDEGTTSVPLDPITKKLISAAIGEVAADQFRLDYDKVLDVPAAWEVAQNPTGTQVPNTGTGKSKIITELTDYYSRCPDAGKDNMLVYVNRLGGEYSQVFYNGLKSYFDTQPNGDERYAKIAEALNITLD